MSMKEEGEYRKDMDIGEDDGITEKPLSRTMIFACYLTALLLVIAIVYGFTGIIADIIKKVIHVDRFIVLSYLSIFYLIYRLTISLGNHWRSNEKNEIGTAVTNFPNPFYDPGYVKGPMLLRKEYKNLQRKYKAIQAFLKKSLNTVDQYGKAIQKFESKLRVLIRHNDNSNRLIKSYNYLYGIRDKYFVEKMLNNILEECITVLEKDQSDKSISLFQVKEDKLIIKESVRINAESVAKRSFQKGEGFAGYIWEIGKAEMVNNIEKGDQRFAVGDIPTTSIGSILGFPLMVEKDIIGVLCIQSESEDGFNEADFRTVEFYARMCTLIFLYDKIKYKNSNGKRGDQHDIDD